MHSSLCLDHTCSYLDHKCFRLVAPSVLCRQPCSCMRCCTSHFFHPCHPRGWPSTSSTTFLLTSPSLHPLTLRGSSHLCASQASGGTHGHTIIRIKCDILQLEVQAWHAVNLSAPSDPQSATGAAPFFDTVPGGWHEPWTLCSPSEQSHTTQPSLDTH